MDVVFYLTVMRLFGKSIPYGREFQVNSYTRDDQGYPTAVFLNDGKIAIAWESIGQNGTGYGVFGRLLDPTDLTEGEEFQIHSTSPDDQRYPNIAARPDGGFVVCWNGKGQNGLQYDMVGQIFD